MYATGISTAVYRDSFTLSVTSSHFNPLHPNKVYLSTPYYGAVYSCELLTHILFEDTPAKEPSMYKHELFVKWYFRLCNVEFLGDIHFIFSYFFAISSNSIITGLFTHTPSPPLETPFLTSSTSSVIWNRFCRPLLAGRGSW